MLRQASVANLRSGALAHARYQPYGLRIPLTPRELALPAMRRLLDASGQSFTLTGYVRRDAMNCAALLAEGTPLPPPW